MKLLWAVACVVLVVHLAHRALPQPWMDEAAWPRVTTPLQVATAALAGWAVGGTREATHVTVAPYQFEVAPSCSGLRGVLMLAATAAVVSRLLPRGWRLAFVVSMGPLGVLLNAGRVTAAILLLPRGVPISGPAHELIGWSGYVLALAALLAGEAAVRRRRTKVDHYRQTTTTVATPAVTRTVAAPGAT